jgi:2-polyprenyl-6-methoxyphenol hydroxylase-like FAD-dependent oxidoreductase
MVGAYVLAHELAATRSHTEAFARYQQTLTPFVQKSQKFARDAAKSGFAPDTRLGILIRDLVMRVIIPRLPVEVMLKEVLAAANAVTLKDYALQGA